MIPRTCSFSLTESKNIMGRWHYTEICDDFPYFRICYREGNGSPRQYLAWKIPRMEEPGGLQSMESRRVRHDWATSLSLFTSMHWRRNWHPTPVFLPGESQGRGSLVAAVYGVAQSQTRLKRLSSSSICYCCFAHFSCTMTVLVWLHWDKNIPPPDVKELMVGARHVLQNGEKAGLLLLPTYPPIIKL